MRASFVVCAVLTPLIMSLSAPVCRAVDTRGIDIVRQKDVLDEEDFKVIEQFIKDAINELVETVDFTQVARLREIIVTRQSEQSQYAEQYSKYLRKYIGEAFSQTRDLEDAVRRHRVRVNLTILVYQLENPRLVDIALDALDDKDESVQYWAARALTGRRLIARLEANSGSSDVVERIATKFESIVETAPPEVICVMADLAAVDNNGQTEGLLLKMADMRIKGYSDWTETASPVDMKLLKLLCDKLQVNDSKAGEFGRRFAQLYSYIMQKYIMVLRGEASLDEEQKQQLASILVEIEDKCIGRLTGLQQTVIKRAVELDDDNTLFLENGRLLGDATRTGELPRKFGFDYGEAEDGSRLTAPSELPKPPGVNK
jgi:hypothetical protein